MAGVGYDMFRSVVWVGGEHSLDQLRPASAGVGGAIVNKMGSGSRQDTGSWYYLISARVDLGCDLRVVNPASVDLDDWNKV